MHTGCNHGCCKFNTTSITACMRNANVCPRGTSHLAQSLWLVFKAIWRSAEGQIVVLVRLAEQAQMHQENAAAGVGLIIWSGS